MAISETRKRFNAEFRKHLTEKGPTFEFDGKTYSKKMASDVESNPYKATSGTYKPRESQGDVKFSSPSQSNSEPSTTRSLAQGPTTSANDRPGPTVARAKEMQAARDRREALHKRDALETDTTPEELVAFAPGLLRMAGKKLFGSAKKGAGEYVKRDPTFDDLDILYRHLTGKNLPTKAETMAKQEVPLLPYQPAAPSKAEMLTQQRAERAAEKYKEMLEENLKRYGMTERTSSDAVNAVRENLGMGQNYTVPRKKGGMIKKYAKGGLVNNSPARGDGCAVRGRTKGKQY